MHYTKYRARTGRTNNAAEDVSTFQASDWRSTVITMAWHVLSSFLDQRQRATEHTFMCSQRHHESKTFTIVPETKSLSASPVCPAEVLNGSLGRR